MLSIDGGMGEGGGQVLRTSLALSLISGKEFVLNNIRQGRKKPGLRAQHLNAVRLAAQIGNAKVYGAEIGSERISFSPGTVRSGKYSSDIGTAGSTSLVLQTVFLPLSFADSPSKLNIIGGTHVPFAPTFDFLKFHWLNFLSKMGFEISINLEKAGFFPKGGGQIRATINPIKGISGISLTHPGSLKQIYGISAVANLDRRIAERQRNTIVRLLGHKYPLNDIRIIQQPSQFKGTTICLVCDFEFSQSCYTSLGKPGKPAEEVAREVCEKIDKFMSTNAVIDEYLADQLLLPLSISETDSFFSTSRITNHLHTNADVIQLFTSAKIEILGSIGSPGTISIKPLTS
jgi:RNA 3'-terminal phosphate cyclase (ATP)